MNMDIERKTKLILTEAIELGASDVHFIPREKDSLVRFRVDGKLLDVERLSFPLIKKLLAHLKFVSGMDIGDRRRPQNRGLEMIIHHQRVFMRLSTFPSSSIETLVIRLFPQDRSKSLDQLSLFPYQTSELLKLIRKPHGLIIICGPTGAGKTTTLYSLLQKRAEEINENIITLEDPVEQRQSGFLQMEINERAGVTYAAGLKSLLRHDPDLIMLGEVRDAETAQMAVRAALTGHIVLTTLHSSSSKGALKRLVDLGVSTVDLEEVVEGVVAQKLVDLYCPYCGETCSLHCRKRRSRRRGAVYEILSGIELRECIKNLEGIADVSYPSKKLNDWVKKGIALGYISEKEWTRFGKGGF
ncbi:competence type IV pilus ATPase ComGA [Salipaludibacillus keqinensis]|nr:competence type IV pilus ATPase ComGA [Salipaludibacillus keqinensis]